MKTEAGSASMQLPHECLLKARLMSFRDDDGYQHHVRYWKPQRLHQGTVLFLHGIQSHGGWYGYSCQRLAEAGFEVVFPDRRGSGLNRQDRGHANSVKELQRDLFAHLEFVRREFPLGEGTPLPPLFLGGISWGGRLAVATALDWNRIAAKAKSPYTELAGLALLYPGIHSHFQPTRLQRLLLSIFARDILGYAKRDIPTNTPEQFTRTPGFVKWLSNDREMLRQASISFFRISQQLAERVSQLNLELKLPVLLMLADEDEIIDNDQTRFWFEALCVADKQLISYPGTRHTLEFEPTRDQFIADLINWLRTHSPTNTKAVS